ncbi:YggS family pyridoxal phosphate-dependent enzyme [Entomomonas asaccharolytica]|uniref:Pyridoxal phosphate homeostasis protein n=1 Tax=Entomomonas asaccharolytica TaxID=2785331 RepID=A0A974RXV2_9GAMM|nr:YggS family pyridoxal phosphate-dependent enzyme [Entomomonas asaccharolytica]QQP86585.1 YggS family pyridoxal phosphate-dependent enzyme [Entomomonas asaccharolytica]
MSEISKNIDFIQQRIIQIAAITKRDPKQIYLLAVSKTKPAKAIQEAFQCGITNFGENYLQEALQKQSELNNLPLIWHFIGPIQSNKTKDIAENFQWVHSVDRLKIAERLNNQRPLELPPLQICIQVNISGEQSKSGCNPAELIPLVEAINTMPKLQLRGLMAIPEPTDDKQAQHMAFATLRKLKDNINQQLNLYLDTLSMGMSYDLEAAIAEGATWLRIGTAIFGERNYKV